MSKKKTPAQLKRAEAMIRQAMAEERVRLNMAPERSPAERLAIRLRDLPWQNSYSNWCEHIAHAAAKHDARIAFGSETYAAWRAGVSPDEYAKARSRIKGKE